MTRCARPFPPACLGSILQPPRYWHGRVASIVLPAELRGRPARTGTWWLPPLTDRLLHGQIGLVPAHKISVFLADDNLIVREGARALIGSAPDMEVGGVAGDYDGLVTGAEQAGPQGVANDSRMAPTLQREGVGPAKQ